MFALIKRYRELIVVSVLLVYPFILFMAHGTQPREPNLLDRAVVAVTSPLQRALGWMIDGVGEGWEGYVALRGVEAERDALAEENARLRQDLARLTEAKLQNARLKALLSFADTTQGEEITARVIGVNPDPRLLSIRIDRGTDSGVGPGQAVVTWDGAVGQVIRATPTAAEVMLLSDPSSRVAARIQRTRARATAAGVAGDQPLSLESVLRTEDLQEGDRVVTSGTDGVFPPGITLGTATGIEKGNTGMFQRAELIPEVDLTRLEEVMVLPPLERTPGATEALSLDAKTEAAP